MDVFGCTVLKIDVFDCLVLQSNVFDCPVLQSNVFGCPVFDVFACMLQWRLCAVESCRISLYIGNSISFMSLLIM